MTMLEDLREVVRCLNMQREMSEAKETGAARYWSERVDSLSSTLIRTHAEQIERDARDGRLLRLLFPDEAGRELARKTLESAMSKEGE